MLETGMTPSSASWHGPPADVVAAASRRHARSLSMFARRLNLDADYYASGLVSRRNPDDVVSFNTLRRDDGVIRRFPEAVARGNRRKRRRMQKRSRGRMSRMRHVTRAPQPFTLLHFQ